MILKLQSLLVDGSFLVYMQFLGPIVSFRMLGRSGARRMASSRFNLRPAFREIVEIKTDRDCLEYNPHRRCFNDVASGVGRMIYLVSFCDV